MAPFQKNAAPGWLFYRQQIIDNVRFVSHRCSDVELITSNNPAKVSNPWTASATRYSRGKRSIVISAGGRDEHEAMQELHQKSAQAVNQFLATNGASVAPKVKTETVRVIHDEAANYTSPDEDVSDHSSTLFEASELVSICKESGCDGSGDDGIGAASRRGTLRQRASAKGGSWSQGRRNKKDRASPVWTQSVASSEDEDGTSDSDDAATATMRTHAIRRSCAGDCATMLEPTQPAPSRGVMPPPPPPPMPPPFPPPPSFARRESFPYPPIPPPADVRRLPPYIKYPQPFSFPSTAAGAETPRAPMRAPNTVISGTSPSNPPPHLNRSPPPYFTARLVLTTHFVNHHSPPQEHQRFLSLPRPSLQCLLKLAATLARHNVPPSSPPGLAKPLERHTRSFSARATRVKTDENGTWWELGDLGAEGGLDSSLGDDLSFFFGKDGKDVPIFAVEVREN